jgi:hypothetical protein
MQSYYFILKKGKILGMIETKFPKFEWGTVCEQNSGHTPNEWGIKKEKPKKIIAYTIIWGKQLELSKNYFTTKTGLSDL